MSDTEAPDHITGKTGDPVLAEFFGKSAEIRPDNTSGLNALELSRLVSSQTLKGDDGRVLAFGMGYEQGGGEIVTLQGVMYKYDALGSPAKALNGDLIPLQVLSPDVDPEQKLVGTTFNRPLGKNTGLNLDMLEFKPDRLFGGAMQPRLMAELDEAGNPARLLFAQPTFTSVREQFGPNVSGSSASGIDLIDPFADKQDIVAQVGSSVEDGQIPPEKLRYVTGINLESPYGLAKKPERIRPKDLVVVVSGERKKLARQGVKGKDYPFVAQVDSIDFQYKTPSVKAPPNNIPGLESPPEFESLVSQTTSHDELAPSYSEGQRPLTLEVKPEKALLGNFVEVCIGAVDNERYYALGVLDGVSASGNAIVEFGSARTKMKTEIEQDKVAKVSFLA